MQIKKLLIADDDRSIRRIAEIILSNATDWQVELAASGQEALDKLKADPPDVVLLDVMMPGMDGLTTLRNIREQLKLEMPVILLTAKTETDDLKLYADLGLAGVICKPFDPIKLASEITTIVSTWQQERVRT
jgi:DNA-binding response OmpR family regulator